MKTENTAVIVLDFINDIVHPDGKVASSANFVKQHNVIDKANQVIHFARNNHFSIVLVKVGFSANYSEWPAHSPIFGKVKEFNALQLGTWSTEFDSQLAIEANDFVIVKHRISAFYGTDLDLFLRTNHIEKLIICGVSTDMAVQATARDAHDRDYQVTIVADACGAANQELHDNSLTLLKRIANVCKSDEL